jgi:hypothetical protein
MLGGDGSIEGDPGQLGGLGEMGGIGKVGQLRAKVHAAVLEFGTGDASLVLPRRPFEASASLGGALSGPSGARAAATLGLNAHAGGAIPFVLLSGSTTLERGIRLGGEAALNEMGDESAPLRLAGARDRIAATLSVDPSEHDFARATAALLRDHGRDESRLGEGYTLEAAIGHRLTVGAPELTLSIQGNLLERNLVDSLPASVAAVLPAGSAIGSVAATSFASAGVAASVRTAHDRAEPLLLPYLYFDGWAGWIWPLNHVGYQAHAGAGVRVLSSTTIALDGYYGSDRVALGSESYSGASLHLTQSF